MLTLARLNYLNSIQITFKLQNDVITPALVEMRSSIQILTCKAEGKNNPILFQFSLKKFFLLIKCEGHWS